VVLGRVAAPYARGTSVLDWRYRRKTPGQLILSVFFSHQRNGLGVEITPDGIYEGQFTVSFLRRPLAFPCSWYCICNGLVGGSLWDPRAASALLHAMFFAPAISVATPPEQTPRGVAKRLWPLRVIQEDLRDGFGVFAKTKGSTYTGEWKKVPAPRRACPDTLWTEAGISLKRCSSTDTPVCVSTHHAADYKGIS